MSKLKIFGLLAFLVGTTVAHADVIGPWITPVPTDGHLFGLPGSTVGWGFQIEGDPVYWISFTDTVLVESAPLGSAGASGYIDFLGPWGGPVDAALPPDPTQNDPWIVPFDLSLSQGLGGYLIDPGVGIGSQDVGYFIVHYLVFSGDPALGGTQIGGTEQLFLPADPSPGSTPPAFQIDVTTASVPEPSTISLLGLGLGFVLWSCRKRRF